MRIEINLPEKFTFTTELPVRITDVNYGGHVGNDAMLGLAHEARLRFLAQHNFSEKEVGGCGLIMTDAAIVFSAQAQYADLLQIEVAIGETSRLGFELFYRLSVKDTGREVARIKTGQVFFDYARGKLARMPEAFKQAFGLLQPA